VDAPPYSSSGVEVPSLSVSASRSANGETTLSLVNLDPRRSAKISIGVQAGAIQSATGRVITAESMDARPDFGQADPLTPAKLERVTVNRGSVSLVAPAKSVIVLKLRLLAQPGGGAKKTAE
jgi:alpha-N-arabinofuranosidase